MISAPPAISASSLLRLEMRRFRRLFRHHRQSSAGPVLRYSFQLRREHCASSEVPEMFGAEQLLMSRAADAETYAKLVSMINRFKEYFLSNHQVVYENPSPGNKAGGITTLEEKSLVAFRKREPR